MGGKSWLGRVVFRCLIMGPIGLIGLIGPISPARAKTDSNSSVFQIIGADLQKSGEKSLLFLTAPFRGSLIDYAWFAGGTAGTVGLIAIDGSTTPYVRSNLDFIRFGNEPTLWKYWGERDYAIIGVGSAYLLGLMIQDEKMRRVARLCGESLLFSAAVTGAGKVIAGRYRPSETNDVWRWNIWETDDAHQSFLSGHATVAFAISSVIAAETDNVAVDVGVYTLATLAALSRVVDGRHWFADVVAGATIGTLCGMFVTHNEDATTFDVGSELKFTPRLNGLGLQYKF
jgi:membrane-associated phospholipid phosphatase